MSRLLLIIPEGFSVLFLKETRHSAINFPVRIREGAGGGGGTGTIPHKLINVTYTTDPCSWFPEDVFAVTPKNY